MSKLRLNIRYVFIFIGAVWFAAALSLGSWVIPSLDAQQQQFREKIESGITLVRLGLLAGGTLALVSSSLWRPGTTLNEPTSAPPPRVAPWLGSAMLFLIVAALACPRLGSSLWWDELNTLTRVVKRGPAVIFSFSSDANNHPLNSMLLWGTLRAIGENEAALRLFPFLFTLTSVQLVYWWLLRPAGLPAAFLAGFATATHPWIISHGVEARGYAGAILFSWLAIICFSHLLTRGSPTLTVIYIISCVTAFGFISTTILVPLAHGAVAVLLLLAGYYRPGAAIYRDNAKNLIFACLWVAILALVLFGLPLPQTLDYARKGATRDHTRGWPLVQAMINYLSGIDWTTPAAVIVALAVVGWLRVLNSNGQKALQPMAVACLSPLISISLYVLLPGPPGSPRFFCFWILPLCCGLGIALERCLRSRTEIRFLVGLLVFGWFGLLAHQHQRLIGINHPDLKALAADLQNGRVVLIGPQSDVNHFYFPRSTSYQEGSRDGSLQEAVANADYVVEGRALTNNDLEKPHPVLAEMGFRVTRTIPDAVPGLTEYVIYQYAAGIASQTSR
jgi:hypothetical protein